jgi:hypothetical protein
MLIEYGNQRLNEGPKSPSENKYIENEIATDIDIFKENLKQITVQISNFKWNA